jgi:hypothetical protein
MCGMIIQINVVRKLQSSCLLNVKATLVATQFKLTTLLQLMVMVKLPLTIIVCTLCTRTRIQPKL